MPTTARTFVAVKTPDGTLYVDPAAVEAVIVQDKPSDSHCAAFIYLGADRAVAVKETGDDLLTKLGIKAK